MSLSIEERFEKMKHIRNELLQFKESPLYEYRLKHKFFPVVGEGSHMAHIIFIGEAPGKNEAQTARPFCGKSGKVLRDALAAQVVAAFERGLDVDSLAAAVLALPGGNKDIMAGGTMQDVDIMKVLSWFNKKELPDTDRLVIVPTNLEEEFYACPMVKQAMSYNQNLLETGVIKIKNATLIVTALASQVDNKDALQAIWGQSIAAVVKNSGLDRFEAYVAGSGLKVVDYAGYGGAKRIYDNGVFALKHQ
mgnify:CR=1 FL=1